MWRWYLCGLRNAIVQYDRARIGNKIWFLRDFKLVYTVLKLYNIWKYVFNHNIVYRVFLDTDSDGYWKFGETFRFVFVRRYIFNTNNNHFAVCVFSGSYRFCGGGIRARVTCIDGRKGAPPHESSTVEATRAINPPVRSVLSLVFKYNFHFFSRYFRLLSKHLPTEFIGFDTNNRWQPSSNKYLNIFSNLRVLKTLIYISCLLVGIFKYLIVEYNNNYGLNLLFFYL